MRLPVIGAHGELLSDERTVLPQPGRRIAVRLGDTTVALIAPDEPGSGPLGDYLARPCSGVFALVWQMTSLDHARRHFTARGLPMIDPLLDRNALAIDPVGMAGARHEFVCR